MDENKTNKKEIHTALTIFYYSFNQINDGDNSMFTITTNACSTKQFQAPGFNHDPPTLPRAPPSSPPPPFILPQHS